MAGLNSTLAIVSTLANSASILGETIGRSDAQDRQDTALRQLQQTQNEQFRQSQEQAALERERISLQAAQNEEERQRALRRAVARQRASFGGSGISSGTSGSAQAVLLGLVNESEDERSRREELDNLRNTAIDQDLSQTRRLNVLQQTQLAERNSIGNLTNRFSSLSRLSGLFQ